MCHWSPVDQSAGRLSRSRSLETNLHTAVTGTKEETCKGYSGKKSRDLARVSRPSDCSTFFFRIWAEGLLTFIFRRPGLSSVPLITPVCVSVSFFPSFYGYIYTA